MLDAWWVREFKRPPEERDGIDLPRLWRAMETSHIQQIAAYVREMDMGKLRELEQDEPELLEELTAAFAAAQGKADGRNGH